MKLDLMPRRRDDMTVRLFGKETVVHDTTKGKIHVLNATASVIWQHCDGDTRLDSLAEHIRGRFATDDTTDVLAEIRRTIGELEQLGLLEDHTP